MVIERPEGNKLIGLYRGKVIQHLPHGRLKVFIPSIYLDEWEVQPDMLPPAEQLTPLFAGSSQGNGVFSYPNIGSIVLCQFINGDQNYPLVIGATLGGENAFGQYSHIFCDIKDENGSILSTDINEVNHSSPSHLITAGKTHLRLFEDGRISAITMTPNDVPINVDYDKNELSTDFPKHDINSQLVMSNIGEISASTNDYIKQIYSNINVNINGEISANSINVPNKTNSDLWFNSDGEMHTSVHDNNANIHSHYKQDVTGNFNIDTHSPSITCNIDAKTDGIMTILTTGSSGHSKIIINADGTLNINTTKSVTIGTQFISMSAPQGVQINANTLINGNLKVSGTVTDSGAVLATHIHGESHGNTTPPL